MPCNVTAYRCSIAAADRPTSSDPGGVRTSVTNAPGVPAVAVASGSNRRNRRGATITIQTMPSMAIGTPTEPNAKIVEPAAGLRHLPIVDDQVGGGAGERDRKSVV